MLVKMSAKFVCSALLCILLFTISVHAGCICNAKGVDYCHKCKPPTFVRPKPRPASYANPELALKPIGDTCSCNKIFVEPAPLPKPCNKVGDNKFDWFWTWNNLMQRKWLETMINVKHECINRLHKRLTNLENVETKYLPISTY